MSTSTRAVEATVTGVVQGVGFRYHCRHEAQRLGVLGWVRNEPDGAVRVHAEGPADAVDGLVAWLHDGPPSASVQRVDFTEASPDGASSFEVTY